MIIWILLKVAGLLARRQLLIINVDLAMHMHIVVAQKVELALSCCRDGITSVHHPVTQAHKPSAQQKKINTLPKSYAQVWLTKDAAVQTAKIVFAAAAAAAATAATPEVTRAFWELVRESTAAVGWSVKSKQQDAPKCFSKSCISNQLRAKSDAADIGRWTLQSCKDGSYTGD